ncbi:MAG: hypothetical protein N3A59_08105 [Thermodesulfovibrionales bacterium]|nr:hypothetical protein [Thermodesulfovibrionales bacterium]
MKKPITFSCFFIYYQPCSLGSIKYGWAKGTFRTPNDGYVCSYDEGRNVNEAYDGTWNNDA